MDGALLIPEERMPAKFSQTTPPAVPAINTVSHKDNLRRPGKLIGHCKAA